MHAGVSDHAGPRPPLAVTRRLVLPSRLVTLSASGSRRFRGSMASLHDPLPTLRLAPRGTRRTAWGRCDSLRLHRRGLAPPTPCRSPGALPTALKVDSWLAKNIQFIQIDRRLCESCHSGGWYNSPAAPIPRSGFVLVESGRSLVDWQFAASDPISAVGMRSVGNVAPRSVWWSPRLLERDVK